MAMLHMITGQGARDDANTVQDFITHCGYDASANRILPAPSGVVRAAWEN